MQLGVINIKGKEYKIFQSTNNNYYIEKPFYVDYQIPNPMKFASRFGNLSNAKVPTFVDVDQFNHFLEIIKSINGLPDKFIKIAREHGFLGNFLCNLTTPIIIEGWSIGNLSLSDIVLYNIVWSTSLEGEEYWKKIHNILITLENENQLQNEDIDRSGDNRSEGNRICCRRDKSESSTGHSSYQACARKRKYASRNHKVYISSRCGSVYRS